MFSDPIKNLEQFGVGPGMKVADIGAGSGFYSLGASRLAGGAGHVYAIDVQKDLLDRLKSQAVSHHLSNLEIVWGDAEKIGGTKIRESLCDRVIVSNILFQAEKKDDLALEVKRILKSGGKVLVIDWSLGAPIGPKTFVTESLATSLFERAGFKKESNINAGDNHYGLIFIKQ
ncbi:MAG: methyltransferase domain-containing protein [bacterium]|nr:methyltransferase domain-containing protein [bacterium]